MKNNKIIKIISSVILSLLIVLIFILLPGFNIHEILQILQTIDYKLIIFSFLIIIIANFFRVYRFSYFFNNRFDIKILSVIVFSHQFFNNMLPYRTGEFSFVYLMRKYNKMPVTVSGSTVIILRIFDFSAFFTLLFISLIFSNIGTLRYNKFILLFLLLFLIIGSFLLIDRIEISIKLFQKLFFNSKKTFIKKILGKLQDLKLFIKETNLKNKLFKLFVITVFINSLVIFNNYIFFSSWAFNLSIFDTVIVSSFTFLTLFLPIQGIANIGTFEGSMLIGLLFFKIDQNSALSCIISLHIISYLVISFQYIIAKVYMQAIKI